MRAMRMSHMSPGAYRTTRVAGLIAFYLVLVVAGLLMLLPFLWSLSTSLKPNEEILSIPIRWVPGSVTFEHYETAFTTVPFARYFANSMVLAVAGVLTNVFLGALAGYAFARLRFRGREVCFMIMLATMMVPSWATLIPSYMMFARVGWLDTFLPILVPAFFAAPFNTFLLRQFFLSVPRELDEAARIDGASTFRTFLFVALPIARPALIIVALFSFLTYWNEFLTPLIYLQSDELYPLSLGVANFIGLQNQDFALAMTGAAIAIAPCLILFFIAQRWFIQGVVITGVKG